MTCVCVCMCMFGYHLLFEPQFAVGAHFPRDYNPAVNMLDRAVTAFKRTIPGVLGVETNRFRDLMQTIGWPEFYANAAARLVCHLCVCVCVCVLCSIDIISHVGGVQIFVWLVDADGC